MIKSEDSVYKALEEVLRNSKEPLTRNEVWDKSPEVRERADDKGINGVSDKLGFMWRKGLLIRYPAPRTSTSFARFSYAWKPEKIEPLRALPDRSKPVVGKQILNIHETKDGVMIELDKIVTTIKVKT